MAIGGIGGALLAGLEGYSQARQQEQRNLTANREMLLRESEFRARQAEQQQQLEAMRIAFGNFGGMGGMSALPGGMPQTPPGAPMMGGPDTVLPSVGQTSLAPAPVPATLSGQDQGDGMRSGGALDQVTQTLTRLGIRPEVAQGAGRYMLRNESGLRPDAVNPTSGATGIAQWLGPRKTALTSQFGSSPTLDQQNQFMSGELQGPERRTADLLRGATTAKEGYDIWGKSFERPGVAALAKAGVDDPNHPVAQAVQGGQALATQVAQTIDPIAQGRASIAAMKEQIDKAAPNADPATKFMALQYMQKMLAPYEQYQLKQLTQQHSEDIRRELEMRHERFQHDERLGREKHEEEMKQKYGPGGSFRGKDENIEVTSEDGQVLYRGVGQRGPDGKYYQPGGAPVPEGTINLLGKKGEAAGSGGGRAGAQVLRQTTAAKEIATDLSNLVRLPAFSSRGILGGRSQGPGLMDALKETFAKELTSRDAQLANSAMADIARELSIVVSPVYGGKWAGEQFKALDLAEGMPVEVKIYNIARMRQVAENALISIERTGWVDSETKKHAKEMREAIAKSVPWTTTDVIDYVEKGEDQQSFGDFVKQQGVGGTEGQQPSGKGKTSTGIEWSIVP